MLDASHMAAVDERKQKKAVERAKARRDLIEETAEARKRVQIDQDHQDALDNLKKREARGMKSRLRDRFTGPTPTYDPSSGGVPEGEGSDFRKQSLAPDVDPLTKLRRFSDKFDGLGSKLRKIVPSMGMIYNAVAALLPVIIALGVQLLGVASAMGAVALAGGAIIGMGLLGHGDSLAESMQNAKLQMRELRNEMFAVAQPTMQEFAPIQEDIFEAIPDASQGIFEEMEGLTAFEDTLFNLGGMAAGGIERFFAIINQNEGKISQLTERMASLGGKELLKFFEFLIETGSKNQDMLVNLASSAKDVAIIIFNISMLFGRVISALKPLTNALAAFSGLLDNKVLVGIITAIVVIGGLIATMYYLVTATAAAVGALSAFGSGGIIGGIVAGITYAAGQIWGLVTSMWAAVGAGTTLAGVLSAITLGGFAIAGGVAGMAAMESMESDRGTREGGDTYIDDRSIEVYTDSSDDLASTRTLGREIDRATGRPDVGNNTTDGS
jgi:hypothetical protein